jgi:hypothetical protein
VRHKVQGLKLGSRLLGTVAQAEKVEIKVVDAALCAPTLAGFDWLEAMRC